MRLSFLTLAFSFLCPWVAKSDPVVVAPELEAPATQFIRVERDDKSTRLQTAVTRFTREGVEVDLIGAVHIADESYYEKLNTSFKAYPVILFEMIGGENLGKGQALENEGEKPAGALGFLGSAFEKMQQALDLKGQKDEVDYSAENFVHADLTIEEFHKLNQEREQSLVSFMLKQAFAKPSGKEPSTAGLLLALLTRNPDKLKLQLVDTLGEGDTQMANIAGDNVIINDRNIKCLAVMQDQIKAGKTKMGIFYGAAHYPDMEKRLIEQGFKQSQQTWLDAWTLPLK
jgi:hypothetical protein